MRVLHVEDSPTDADLTRRLLARQAPEIELDRVSDQTAARMRLQDAADFDLALVDLRLPDGSGLELLAWIREHQLPLAVVMLTGSGDQESAIAALQAGADDYLTKDVAALERLPVTLRDAYKRFHEARVRHNRPLRVLYAEHKAADIDLTRRHLARYAPHIRLSLATDVGEVLARLPSDPGTPADFDLVLLDL
jgi:CheY-like chemotaxis protein